MSEKCLMARRDLLGLTVGGLGLLALNPLLSRVAHAAPGLRIRARRVLFLNLAGGSRSSAAFLASGSKALNPFGRIDGPAQPFGKLLDDHLEGETRPNANAYSLRAAGFRGQKILPFREIANDLAVVG